MQGQFQVPNDGEAIISLHFYLLQKREELMTAQRHAEALPFAVQDTWLTPALVRADRSFKMNREDAIMDVVGCASQMKQPELALPHLRWALDVRLVSATKLEEYVEDLSYNMQVDGADQTRVSQFLAAAKALGVISAEQADVILSDIQW